MRRHGVFQRPPGIALPLGLALLLAFAAGCTARPAAPVPGRFALLAGASGELAEPGFFVEDLGELREALTARGWQVSVVAGSSDGLLPGSVRASNAQLLAGVRDTLGRAGAGQQALLLFHSHGREQETYWGQRSHSIVSEDRDALGNEPGFDLDALEPELLKARARGVRVALVDLSCYSGSTQALQGPACTVSLASSRYVSLCSGRKEERHFNARFFRLPPPGTPVDLESQFLEARRADHDSINLPGISSRVTPAQPGWESFLAEADPLDTYEDLKDLKADTPLYDPRLLLGELDQWVRGRHLDSMRLGALRAEIGQKLARIVALQKRLRARMPALARDYDDRALSVEIQGRPPMKLGAGYLAELLQAAGTGQLPEAYSDVQRNLVKSVTPLRGMLATRYAGPLSAFQRRREEFDQDTDSFARAADSLFDSERALYELGTSQPVPDPCRDFSL